MGYGKIGWFNTYINMMKNSFEYANNSVSNRDHWIARAFALLFALVWYVFTIVVFILVPLFLVYLGVVWLGNLVGFI